MHGGSDEGAEQRPGPLGLGPGILGSGLGPGPGPAFRRITIYLFKKTHNERV